jgi:predicted glycosyltransferase
MLNVDLANKHVWGRTDILLKLHIAKGNKKVESLIAKIQKRVPSLTNTTPKSKQDKSDEKKVEEFYVQILESLFGFLVRMKGFAAESNFVTVRDTLEAISLNHTLNKSMIKDLGISAEEYIILLGDDENQGLPESTMNHLLNSMNAEAN